MERAFNFSSLVKLPQYCPHGGKKVPIYGYLLKVGNIMKVRSGKERYAGFELAVRNLQFAKHFGSLWMNFRIFSKNCELLKSDTSCIFTVIHWTSYMQSYFKPNKYPLLNNNVISQRFIVHINFKLHTSFISVILLRSSKS